MFTTIGPLLRLIHGKHYKYIVFFLLSNFQFSYDVSYFGNLRNISIHDH